MISAVSALRLADVIPRAYAMEMLLMARNLTVAEAQRFGLINAVVDDVDAEARRWAETIAGYSPVAVQATMRLAKASQADSLAAARQEIEAARSWVETHDDYKHGAAAFEKRS